MPETLTLAVFARALEENAAALFGSVEKTNELSSFSINSKDHELRKRSIEERFFYVLSHHEKFKYLTPFIDDPECPGSIKLRTFYVCLRGLKSPMKKRILNFTMLLFSMSFVKKEFDGQDLSDPKVFADAQYEPSTVDMFLRCLFSVFSSHGIVYRKDHDFNETGDFPGYWKDTFAKSQVQRPDYGTKSNAATFDSNYKRKRRAAIDNGTLNPLTDYDHHTWILLEDFLTHNMLRGSQEPCMVCRADIESGIMPVESDFAGKRFYRLKAKHSGQKGNALTLTNTSVQNEKNINAYVPMVEDPSDPFCLFYLLERHLNVYLPTQFTIIDDPTNGRIFRRMASEKQLKVVGGDCFVVLCFC